MVWVEPEKCFSSSGKMVCPSGRNVFLGSPKTIPDMQSGAMVHVRLGNDFFRVGMVYFIPGDGSGTTTYAVT